ncbi:hypothetical protein [Nocardia sp. NBC_00403]|uniref:hypothetical protein n=1 Tax=Nocardia sp. NBC_00403 TaxID=2975990 RepID=UPI002E23B4C6
MTSPILRCTTESLPGIGASYIAGGTGLHTIVGVAGPMCVPAPAAIDDVSPCLSGVFGSVMPGIFGTTAVAALAMLDGGEVHVPVSIDYTTSDIDAGGEITCHTTSFTP